MEASASPDDGPADGSVRRAMEDGGIGQALDRLDAVFTAAREPLRLEPAQDTYADLVEYEPTELSSATFYVEQDLGTLQGPDGSPFEAFSDDAEAYRLVTGDTTLRFVPDEQHTESVDIETQYDSIDVAVPTPSAYAEDVSEKLYDVEEPSYLQN